MIEVKYISAEDTYQIRKQILRKNSPLSEKTEGDFDKNTFHLGAFNDTKLVSVATFMQNNCPHFEGVQYRLRGMATLENHQQKGFGKLLIKRAEIILKERRATVLWCNARIGALNFYKRLSFKTKGSKFDIQYIGLHYIMYKQL